MGGGSADCLDPTHEMPSLVQPLRKLVEDSLAKKGYISTNGTISPSGKNGANGSRSHGLKVKVGAKSIVKAKSGNASRRKPTRGKAKTSH